MSRKIDIQAESYKSGAGGEVCLSYEDKNTLLLPQSSALSLPRNGEIAQPVLNPSREQFNDISHFPIVSYQKFGRSLGRKRSEGCEKGGPDSLQKDVIGVAGVPLCRKREWSHARGTPKGKLCLFRAANERAFPHRRLCSLGDRVLGHGRV